MAPDKKHFLPSGKEYKGPTHSAGGRLMTGSVHTPSSVFLVHKEDMMKNSDMNRDMKMKKMVAVKTKTKGSKSKKMPSKLLDYFKSLKKK